MTGTASVPHALGAVVRDSAHPDMDTEMPRAPEDVGGSNSQRYPPGAIGIAFIAVVIALAIYEPWRYDPFPLRDFGRLLGLLAPTSDVGSAYEALTQYFAHEGRFQPIFMWTVALQWVGFGLNIVAWQVVRFALMTAVFGLTILVAQRCGATPRAAVLGAFITIIVATGAHESWFLLQVAEPMATAFLLLAALVAIRWDTERRPYLLAAILGALSVLAVLSKESMIAGVPFLMALMLVRSRGGWRWPQFDRTTILSLGVIIVMLALCAVVPILLVRASARGATYASQLSLTTLDTSTVWNSARAIFLPITRVIWFPANALFWAVIATGWIGFLRAGAPGRLAALCLLSLPLPGVLLYSAWPAFPPYYAMPFLPALGIGFALAIQRVVRSPSKAVRALGLMASIVVCAYGVMLSWNGAQGDRAIRRADLATVELASTLNAADTVLVSVLDPAFSGAHGVSVQLYGRAIGLPEPAVAQDVPCQHAYESTLRPRPSVAVLLLSQFCADSTMAGASPTRARQVHFRQMEWKTFRVYRDSMTVHLWAHHEE